MILDLHDQVTISPALPLRRVATYNASALPLELINIPDVFGDAELTGVGVSIVNADGLEISAPCVRRGDQWRVAFAASCVPTYGFVERGVKVTVSVREDSVDRDIVLGVGDLEVMRSAPSAEPGDPSKGYVTKGSDRFDKSKVVDGVQHFVKQTMEYDEEMHAWGATWTGDYILEDGEFIPYEAPTGGGVTTAAVALALLLAPFVTSAITATKEYVDRKDGEIAQASTNYTDSAIAEIPAPDFSTSNAVLVATIEATAPTPTADEIGAVAKAFVAEEYDPGKDYKIGDVVRIDGRFYVFIDDWYHQWGGSPIDYEAAVELSDLGEVIKYRNARDFLTLGDGGTNSPSFKRILTGWDNDKPCYFTIETTGWIIDGPYPNKIRLVNQELRVTTNNWDSFWSLRLPEVLQKENVAPMSNEYFSEEFKKSPTSPWHVYSYLTNNYTRTADMAVTYLTKSEASSTYISEAAADSKYSTPAGIASAISSALDNFRPQYLYNKDGNYRLDVNGKVQRQTHNGYNVNWTNESTGVVFVYSNPDSWTCNHPTLGAIHFTRSDGVMYCNEYPPVRATEDYPNTTVLSFGAPIGTMRAIPNAAGSILWNDYKQFADTGSVVSPADFISATNSLTSATPNGI